MTRTAAATTSTDTDELETQDAADTRGTSTKGIYIEDLSIRDLRAGRAVFTVVTNQENKSFTYLFKRRENDPEKQEKYGQYIWYVSLLTGSNQYTYMGVLTQDNNGMWIVKHTAGSKIMTSAPSWQVIAWLLRKVTRNEPYNYAKGARVVTEGRCWRCKTPLTRETSRLNRYGDWCYRQMLLGK